MRLTCPSCGAKYEIAAEMIPAGGRDVQCSNCSTTWFQLGEPKRPAPVESLPDLRSAKAPGGERGRGVPQADDAVLDILREERAFEQRARAADAGFATDDDYDRWDDDTGDDGASDDDGGAGAPDAPEAVPGAAAPSVGERERARMAAAAALAHARRKGGTSNPDVPENADTVEADPDGASVATPGSPAMPDPVAAPAAPPAPRDRLPAIDAVRTEPPQARHRDDGATVPKPAPRTGFRFGFFTALAVLGVAAAIYVYAGDIAAAVPDLADTLTGYVAFVDAQRVALARGADALTAWFDGV